MKKCGIFSGLLMSMGLLLTGCSNSFDYMPDLTEEESALISEYAAGILIKHDKYGGKIASDAEIIKADDREARLKASAETFAEMEREKKAAEKEEKKKSGSKSESSAPEVQMAFQGIAEFCGKDDFRIQYTGYTLCDSYPEGDEAEKVFAMDATEGNQLLVLKFSAENLTDEDKELDIFHSGIKFKVAINEEKERSVLTTLLLDDLSSYKDMIPAKENVPLVLIREIAKADADKIERITLHLQNGSENATTSLQ